MILDDADKKIRYFNRIGIHYEAVYHHLIRNRYLTPVIFSPQLIDDITAGLISFDMQRMMGSNKYLIYGKPSWAFHLIDVLRKHEKLLTNLKNLELQNFDFSDTDTINKISCIFDDLAKNSSVSLNFSGKQKGFQVGASKILHFLIPDLFIIVDSNARSELANHYGFSKHKKIDGQRYVAAMQLYQKELIKWAGKNNDPAFSKLLALDPSWKNFRGERETPLPRIIDKCTFVGDKIFFTNHYLPITFNASIGGYPGGFSKIELYGDTLISAKYDIDFELIRSKSIRPSKKKWKAFIKKIDELGIWEWKCEYPNPGVMDGTQWGVEIQYEDKKLCSHGDNSYPGMNGSCSSDVTTEFKIFLQSVDILFEELHFR